MEALSILWQTKITPSFIPELQVTCEIGFTSTKQANIPNRSQIDTTAINWFIMKASCLYEEAIAREKQIKAGSRKKKEELIRQMNPDWHDLFEQIDD